MQVFAVKGMTCGHCVKAVTDAIQGADAQAKVDVELATGKVSVDSQLTAQELSALIQREGYSVSAS